MNKRVLTLLCTALTGASLTASGISLVYPNNRTTYYSHEEIEMAFADIPAGETATITLSADGTEDVSFDVTGTGSTVAVELPSYALAPAAYTVSINGENLGGKLNLKVARGVWPSEMYVSQTGKGYKNFKVSNAFNFGMRDADGQPVLNPRSSKSTLERYETLIMDEIPAFIYMYWTGFVLHKPWGIHKEWASPDIIENTRLFNFHVAQRIRRFDDLMFSIGSIDEPGLPWGRTAAGGSASGFTGWNVADWLAERGFEWTDDPGSLSDEDFRRYMKLRTLMLREPHGFAAEDIKEVWPDAVYASDLYAPQAVGDGTDPLNQVVNDIPTTHVFADYGIGKQGVLAGMYLEKAHDPLSKIAHAMNGQLFGDKVRGPKARHAYHLMMNVMLAAGLDSNWWLNHSQMTQEDLEAVNEPAARIGSIFDYIYPSDHDIAVLWSNTEIWMRVKGVMKVEASNADGEQKALMVADLPEDAIGEDGKLKYNAYNVGGNYKGEILTTFMAVNRAGYPAHILHEALLEDGALDNYKVLVITHQVHELPPARRKAIQDWQAKGGTLIVDATTTVPFEGAVVVDAPTVVNQGFAWSAGHTKARKDRADLSAPQTNTFFFTNHFMEQFSRDASPAYEAALTDTDARQVLETDSVQLAVERHLGGDLELMMVINGYEELPELDEGESYDIWNYAPYEASYRLPLIEKGESVYLIEGLDWKTVSKVENPTAIQKETFEPGEMKLYFVLPADVKGLALKTRAENGTLKVNADLKGPGTPLPLAITVTDPNGSNILSFARSTDTSGSYSETLPIGMNAPEGDYSVQISSPIADLSDTKTASLKAPLPKPEVLAGAVRVFDEQVIRDFLAKDPAVTIAVGNPEYQPVAESLKKALTQAGLTVSVEDEETIWEKAMYPRVWDPYMPVFSPTEEMKDLPEVRQLDERGRPVRDENKDFVMIPGEVNLELTIESEFYETPTLTTANGEAYTGKWKKQGTLLTVGPKGYVVIGNQEKFYEPGVKIFYTDRRRSTTLNTSQEQAKTTEDFRRKWERPWKRIIGHVGGYNLTPQLPEVYRAEGNLILLGDSEDGTLVRALQASELLLQWVDDLYPGPGKALIQYAWSPFALEKDVIYIGASNLEGLEKGADKLTDLLK